MHPTTLPAGCDIASLAIVAGAAFLLLALAHHWLLAITAGNLHQLWRYVAGQVLILAVYAAWCCAPPGSLSPGWALAGLLATVIGAGAGTVSGYIVDRWAARERALHYLERGREPSPRAPTAD